MMEDVQGEHIKSTVLWGRRFLRHRSGIAGFVILIFLILMALLAPWISPHNPYRQNPVNSLSPPGTPGHLLGTDQYGRDLLSRIIYGTRLSLRIGLIAVSIGCGVGLLAGGAAGLFGGWLDEVIMRFMDILLAFPGILLAMAIVAVAGPGMTNLMIAVGISSTPVFARLVRSSVLSVRETDYVQAAYAAGAGYSRAFVFHILPNILPPLGVYATLRVATAILSAAGLSYLGLGAEPPTAEWGLMLSSGRQYMRSAWWLTTFPGVAIIVTVMSINLFGDALRDIVDPRFARGG